MAALRALGIEPAERPLCGWAGTCLALLGAAAFGLLNSSETLFLKRVGVDSLPWVLLASSGVLVLTTGVAGRVLPGSDRPRALPRVLLGLAVPLVPLWWLLRGTDSALVFGAFVLMARQVLALGLLVFWVALADLMTGRQAKRLFAPLAAGITLGGIAGSFGSEPMARAVGVEGVVLVCAGLLSLSALAAGRLRAAAPRRAEHALGGGRRGSSAGASTERASLAELWSESLLFRLLFGALLCGGLLSPVLYFEFSYMADAATTGPNGEQELLALYGQFRGWLNVAMLVAQLWLSTRLYRRLGLPLTLALWPASFLLGFGWLAAAPSLVAGVVALGSGRLIEDGIGGSALRVLFTLFPERLRSSAAGALEGPVNRLGGVLGNALVLGALALGAFSAMAWAALPVAAVWLGIALTLWRAYPSLLLQATADRSFALGDSDTAKLLDAGTLRALIPSLADADPRVSRAAVELVGAAAPEVSVEVLAEALEEAPPQTRALLVDALHRTVDELGPGGNARAAGSLAQVLAVGSGEERAGLLQSYARLAEGAESTGPLVRALGDSEAAVRLVAIAELHRRGQPPPGVRDLDEVLRQSLEEGDVLMRRVARQELRAMLQSKGERWLERLALLAERLEQRADRAETAEALVDVARRHDGEALPAADEMVRWIDDRDPRVRAAVLRFVGHAGMDRQVGRLVSGLGALQGDIAAAAREGLVALGADAAAPPLLEEYEFGAPARRTAAMSVLRDLELEPDAFVDLYRRQLAGVRTAVVLRAALEPVDGQTQDPGGLMSRRLEERVDEGIGSLLAYIAVLEEDERVSELEGRLRRASSERERDILVEALEAVLPSVARRDLLPLVEGTPWEKRAVLCADALGRRQPSAGVAWHELAADHDPVTSRLARYFGPEAVEERRRMGDAHEVQVLDPMEVAVRLQGVPAFGRLTTQQLMGLAEVLEEVRVDAGEGIFQEGDEGDGLYFVYEGAVEIHRGGRMVSRVEPVAFIGELATLDGVPRTVAARAAEPTVLLRLEREELLAMMESVPALGIGFAQFMSGRVRTLQDRLDRHEA